MMPPLLFALDEPVGLYPIEACLYAIEVKAKATARDVRHAIDVGQSVGALRYVPEHCLGEDPLSHVITLLFAFDSTMRTPEREHERWRRLQLDRPRTRVARVVDNAGNWVADLLPPLFVASSSDAATATTTPCAGRGRSAGFPNAVSELRGPQLHGRHRQHAPCRDAPARTAVRPVLRRHVVRATRAAWLTLTDRQPGLEPPACWVEERLAGVQAAMPCVCSGAGSASSRFAGRRVLASHTSIATS